MMRPIILPNFAGHGHQSQWLPVNSSHGHVVTRSTRHRSTRHTSGSSHSQLVRSEHISLTKPPVVIFGRLFVKRSHYAIARLSVGAGHIVLDGFPVLHEGAQHPPLLGPCLLRSRSPISATAELLFYLHASQVAPRNSAQHGHRTCGKCAISKSLMTAKLLKLNVMNAR